MEVVILAGGRGTRMGSLTEEIPKPMVCIGDEPIIIHLIDYYLQWGATKIVFCCGYKGDYITDYLSIIGKSSEVLNEHDTLIMYHSCSIITADTGISEGTAERIKIIEKYIDEDYFYLTYGDGLSDVDLQKLTEAHLSTNNLITISVIQPRERFGVVEFSENGTITAFKEKEDLTPKWINVGFMVANKEIFRSISDDDISLERDSFPRFVSENEMGVYCHKGFWKCMDTIQERDELNEIWNSGNIPWRKNSNETQF